MGFRSLDNGNAMSNKTSFKRKPEHRLPRPRARLTESQVLSIFRCKYSAATPTKLAVIFGVSEKAVRDILTGRTWARQTWHLEVSRVLVAREPKDSKDVKNEEEERQDEQKRTGAKHSTFFSLETTVFATKNIRNEKSLDDQLFDWANISDYHVGFGGQHNWRDPFLKDWNNAKSEFEKI